LFPLLKAIHRNIYKDSSGTRQQESRTKQTSLSPWSRKVGNSGCIIPYQKGKGGYKMRKEEKPSVGETEQFHALSFE
jgi:hypothetical protein